MDAGKFIVAIGVIILLISVGGILISILKDVINDLIEDGPDLALIMLVFSFFGIVIVIAGLLIIYLNKRSFYMFTNIMFGISLILVIIAIIYGGVQGLFSLTEQDPKKNKIYRRILLVGVVFLFLSLLAK